MHESQIFGLVDLLTPLRWPNFLWHDFFLYNKIHENIFYQHKHLLRDNNSFIHYLEMNYDFISKQVFSASYMLPSMLISDDNLILINADMLTRQGRIHVWSESAPAPPFDR